MIASTTGVHHSNCNVNIARLAVNVSRLVMRLSVFANPPVRRQISPLRCAVDSW